MALVHWLGGLRAKLDRQRRFAVRRRRGPLSGVQSLEARVLLDGVNQPPVIAAQSFSLAENSPFETSVGTVSASDPDAEQFLSYAITSGNTQNAFSIDSLTGQIVVSNEQALDFESHPTFSLTVQVTDDANPALSASAVITISLSNVDEAAVLTGLALVNDTGTVGDLSTEDPRITGTVADPEAATGPFTVELDVDADGYADTTATVNATTGSFTIDPTGLIAPGETTVALRAVQANGLAGEWSTFAFTLETPSSSGGGGSGSSGSTPPSNPGLGGPTITGLAVTIAAAASGGATPYQATASGTIAAGSGAAPPSGGYQLQFDTDGNGTADQTLWTTTATFNLTVGVTQATAAVAVRVVDPVSGNTGAWQQPGGSGTGSGTGSNGGNPSGTNNAPLGGMSGGAGASGSGAGSNTGSGSNTGTGSGTGTGGGGSGGQSATSEPSIWDYLEDYLGYAVFAQPDVELALEFPDEGLSTDYLPVAAALANGLAAPSAPNGAATNEIITDGNTTVTTASVLGGTLTTTTTWTSQLEKGFSDGSGSTARWELLTKTYQVLASWADGLGNVFTVEQGGDSTDYQFWSTTTTADWTETRTIVSHARNDTLDYTLSSTTTHTDEDDWEITEAVTMTRTAAQWESTAREEVLRVSTISLPDEHSLTLVDNAGSEAEYDGTAQVIETSTALGTVLTTTWVFGGEDEWLVNAQSDVTTVGANTTALDESLLLNADGSYDGTLTWSAATNYATTLTIDPNAAPDPDPQATGPHGFSSAPSAWEAGITSVAIQLTSLTTWTSDVASDYAFGYTAQDSLSTPDPADRQSVDFNYSDAILGGDTLTSASDLSVLQTGTGLTVEQTWTDDADLTSTYQLLLTGTGTARGVASGANQALGRAGTTFDACGLTTHDGGTSSTTVETERTDTTRPDITIERASSLAFTSSFTDHGQLADQSTGGRTAGGDIGGSSTTTASASSSGAGTVAFDSLLTITDTTATDGTVEVLTLHEALTAQDVLTSSQANSTSSGSVQGQLTTGAWSSDSTSAFTVTASGTSSLSTALETTQSVEKDASPFDFHHELTTLTLDAGATESWSQSVAEDATTEISHAPAAGATNGDGAYQFDYEQTLTAAGQTSGLTTSALSLGRTIDHQSPSGQTGTLQYTVDDAYAETRSATHDGTSTGTVGLTISDAFSLSGGQVQAGAADPVVTLTADSASHYAETGAGTLAQSSNSTITAQSITGGDAQAAVRDADPREVRTMTSSRPGSVLGEAPSQAFRAAEFESDIRTLYTLQTSLTSQSTTQFSDSLEIDETFTLAADESTHAVQTVDGSFDATSTFQISEVSSVEQESFDAAARFSANPSPGRTLGYGTTDTRLLDFGGGSTVSGSSHAALTTATWIEPATGPDDEPKLRTSVTGAISGDATQAEQVAYSFSLTQTEGAEWRADGQGNPFFTTGHQTQATQTGTQSLAADQSLNLFVNSDDETIDDTDLVGTSTQSLSFTMLFAGTQTDGTTFATDPSVGPVDPSAGSGGAMVYNEPPLQLADSSEITTSGETRDTFDQTVTYAAAGPETATVETHETDTALAYLFVSVQSAGGGGTATVGASGTQSSETRFREEVTEFADETSETLRLSSSHVIETGGFGGTVTLSASTSSTSPLGATESSSLSAVATFSGGTSSDDEQWEQVITNRQGQTITTSGRELITTAGNSSGIQITAYGSSQSPGVVMAYSFTQSQSQSGGRQDHQIWQNGNETAHYFDESSTSSASQSMELTLAADDLTYLNRTDSSSGGTRWTWLNATSGGQINSRNSSSSWELEIYDGGILILRQAGSASASESSEQAAGVGASNPLNFNLVAYAGAMTSSGSTTTPSGTISSASDRTVTLTGPNTLHVVQRQLNPNTGQMEVDGTIPTQLTVSPSSAVPSYVSASGPSGADVLADFHNRLQNDSRFAANGASGSEAVTLQQGASGQSLTSAVALNAGLNAADLTGLDMPTTSLPGVTRLSNPVPSLAPTSASQAETYTPAPTNTAPTATYNLATSQVAAAGNGQTTQTPPNQQPLGAQEAGNEAPTQPDPGTTQTTNSGGQITNDPDAGSGNFIIPGATPEQLAELAELINRAAPILAELGALRNQIEDLEARLGSAWTWFGHAQIQAELDLLLQRRAELLAELMALQAEYAALGLSQTPVAAPYWIDGKLNSGIFYFTSLEQWIEALADANSPHHEQGLGDPGITPVDCAGLGASLTIRYGGSLFIRFVNRARLGYTLAPTTTAPASSALLTQYLSGSGGRWGGAATRQLNHRLATNLETHRFRVTGGAGRAAEEWIPGPGGSKAGGTWVDITGTNGTQTVRIQTVSTLTDGITPTAYELAAAERILAAFPNDLLILVSKQTGLVIP